MKQDEETFQWLAPTVLMMTVTAAMRSSAKLDLQLDRATYALSDMAATAGVAAGNVLNAMSEFRVLPNLPVEVAQWLAAALIVMMLLASALNAVVHEGEHLKRENRNARRTLPPR
jgi:cation transporter-like permease